MKRLRTLRVDFYGLLLLYVGVMALLEVFVRHIPERLEPVFYLVPEGVAWQVLFTLGLLLVYLSAQISRRKRNAWYATVALLTALLVFSLSHRFLPVQILSYLGVLVFFLLHRREFAVRSDSDSFRRGVRLALLQVAVAIGLTGLIFAVLDQREFGRHLTTIQTLHFTYDALLGNPLPQQVGVTHYDRTLIDLLRLTGVASAIMLLWSLFRPLRIGGSSTAGLRAQAAAILTAYGNDPEDFFKLYPEDKHYFFYGESFVAYTVKHGVALVLDGSCGRQADTVRLRKAFAEHCRTNSWYIALVHSSKAEAKAWAAYGMETMQIGSEAIIDSSEFTATTLRNKHFRYVFNRARKDELGVEWWQPPLTTTQLHRLRYISDAWVHSGRQEYGFLMAPFHHEYLQRCTVAVLKAGDKPVAYANLIPSYGVNKTASIDHMRSLPETSSVAMHYLLAQCINRTHTDGFSHFNLGFVPLAKLTTESLKLTNRLLAIGRRLGSRFYSSAGLEQFKGKFEPDWSPRYLAYQGGLRQLPLVANALRQAISYRPPRRRKPYVVLPVTLITIAGLCYASFPFAWFLNRPYAFSGLTSALGGEGQPYAWFFNISDIVSGVLTIAVLCWLHRFWRPHSKTLRLTLNVAIFSALCTSLAALIPIPHEYKVLDGHITFSLLHNPMIVLHGLASFCNSFAFVVAAVLWAIHWRRTDGHLWRQLFVGFMLLLSTVGFVVGQIVPGLAGTIQRAFITLYAVWFVLLTVDVLTVNQKQK
jgi:phosphatidylglycerol lysyltransferase